jgi:hypothetical protein
LQNKKQHYRIHWKNSKQPENHISIWYQCNVQKSWKWITHSESSRRKETEDWLVQKIMWLGMYHMCQSLHANAGLVPWNRPSVSFPFTSCHHHLILPVLHKHSS